MLLLLLQIVTGVTYRPDDGVERVARAHLTIVCDGMYSNLRKHLSQPQVSRWWPGRQAYRSGTHHCSTAPVMQDIMGEM
jgi:2-polyprenyl-6-methoxyphenol hydroxylase-like FAD-dependent oxidoreductase